MLDLMTARRHFLFSSGAPIDTPAMLSVHSGQQLVIPLRTSDVDGDAVAVHISSPSQRTSRASASSYATLSYLPVSLRSRGVRQYSGSNAPMVLFNGSSDWPNLHQTSGQILYLPRGVDEIILETFGFAAGKAYLTFEYWANNGEENSRRIKVFVDVLLSSMPLTCTAASARQVLQCQRLTTRPE